MKKTIAILALALMSCGSVVLAGQNSNSSTTMQPHENMGRMHGRRGRRHARRWHRRHRRHGRHGHMGNMNSNTH
ncbi:MAG TPA: hypothetical protein VIW64_02945 [Pyrinomonadaceae bacterium]|jgi:hypothetical protein